MDDRDGSKFQEEYEKYNQLVYNYAYSRTHNIQEAEDIAAEAWIRAWKSWRTFEDRERTSGWIIRIARNLIIDLGRRKQVMRFTTLDPLNEESLLIYEDTTARNAFRLIEIDQEQIVSQLSKIPKRYQRVLLAAVHGDTMKQIAEREHTTSAAIKARIFRARQQLQAVR